MKLAQTLLAQSSGKDPQAPGPARPADLDISGTPEPGTDSFSSPMDRFLAGVEHKAFKIAVYALRDNQTALDVVQDAMFKLVEKYSNKPESEWPPLFFTILNNRITDIRRWRKLREVGGKTISLFRNHGDGEEDLLETGLGTELNSPRMQPEKVLLSKQIRERIDSALENLSDRQRQVFMLREWQGMSVRDTATVLGCSEGSVKQHHFRAMRCLREQLNEIRDHGHT
jgi:RNA polymerase sigma-70 factor (ECF subfamily)